MRTVIRRLGLATLTLAWAVGGLPSSVHGAVRPAPARFVALDGGPVLPHIKVTAMTTAPGGALYAAGVYVVRSKDPYAVNPVGSLGSTWLVSRDHGATWTRNISTIDPKAFPKNGIAAWTNHAALPIDFTPMSITIDPHNANTIYVAGCVDIDATCSRPTPGAGAHLVVRSTDGGRTWQDVLTTSTPIVGIGAKPPGTALPTAGYAVLVDPRDSRRLYAAVNDVGVLRSEDAGRMWLYVPQPQSNYIGHPCELLGDPQNARVVYELAREGALYRTTDAGTHWQTRALLGGQLHTSSVSSLTWVGRALYLTTNKGLYTSNDGGSHWRLAYGVPMAGAFYTSVRAAGGWISVFGSSQKGAADVYALRDGGSWQPVANTDARGPQYFGSLDLQAMDADAVTRVWEDPASHVLFTSGPLGGLYRWRSTV